MCFEAVHFWNSCSYKSYSWWWICGRCSRWRCSTDNFVQRQSRNFPIPRWVYCILSCFQSRERTVSGSSRRTSYLCKWHIWSKIRSQSQVVTINIKVHRPNQFRYGCNAPHITQQSYNCTSQNLYHVKFRGRFRWLLSLRKLINFRIWWRWKPVPKNIRLCLRNRRRSYHNTKCRYFNNTSKVLWKRWNIVQHCESDEMLYLLYDRNWNSFW